MRLVMMGTGTFAEPTLEALLHSSHQVVGLVTQPDRAVGAERGSTRQTGKGMKTIAQEKGVPIYQPESINTPEGVAQLQAWSPDLLVVAAYGQILKPDVLAAAKHGGINVHASLLPKYRGAAPIAWAIYQGETQTGVTIIQMTPQLDAGGMIGQVTVDIGAEETSGELEVRLAPLGAKLALESIEQIIAGTAKPMQQDKGQVTKAPKLKKEDGIIDWTRPAEQVCRQIRAMQPWPTAYTLLHRQGKEPVRIIVNRAVPLPTPEIVGWEAPTGAISVADGKNLKLVVWCGGSTQVEVLELQPAGKRRMAAVEFLRGSPPREGDRFGPEAS
ncbi:MAG: methionyl-tRNA formyltransferase [Planctomycetia bacterium]|nr:methionyl-tRNA formyltransferase [Planctomycetia bacterium]